jgi:hypothetical protein
MADSDSNQALKPPRLPPLIPGIYNYCDGRCARCRFSQRCLSHLARERFDKGDDRSDVFDEIIREREVEPREPPQEFLDAVFEANDRFKEEEMSEELEEALREHEAQLERAHVDHLVVAAHHYARTAWTVAEALERVGASRSDPVTIEAVETIGELAGTVASKTFRAVSSSLGEDFDLFDLDHDANGSAKVARLTIAESKRAWYALMETGRAAADGVPIAMFRVLDEIDAGLAARFPRAMAFVRPGFDTEHPP